MKRLFSVPLGGYAMISAENESDAIKQIENIGLYPSVGAVWHTGDEPFEVCPLCYRSLEVCNMYPCIERQVTR